MGTLSRAVEAAGHLMAVDAMTQTVAFVDAELHFANGHIIQRCVPIHNSPSELTDPASASTSMGDTIRKSLFATYDGLADYHIVDTVTPFRGREFRRRLRAYQTEISTIRVGRTALSVLSALTKE